MITDDVAAPTTVVTSTADSISENVFEAYKDQTCVPLTLQEEADGKIASVNSATDTSSAEAMYGKQSVSSIGSVGPYGSSLPSATSTCFVFYVPSNWDDEEMKSNFSKVGTVVSSHVARKPDGTSRGFGFVSYASADLARAAVAAMNGFILSNGKRLKVSLKTDSSQGTSHSSQYSGAAPGPYSPTYFGCNIFVASFPANWTEDELRSHFLACGKIVSASIRRNQELKESAPYGFVTFDSQAGAQTAVSKMNGVMIGGRKLRVSIKRGEERTPGYSAFHSYGYPTAFNPAAAGSFMPMHSVMSSYANPVTAAGYGSMGYDPYQFYSSLVGMPGATGMNGMGGMASMNDVNGYAAAAAALGAMQQDGGAGRTGIGASAVDSNSQEVATGAAKYQNPQQASAVRGSWDMSANIAAMQQLALMQQWQLQQQAQGGAAYGAAAAAKPGTHPMMTQYNIPGNLYGYGAQNVATAAAVPTGSNPLYGANPSVSVQRK